MPRSSTAPAGSRTRRGLDQLRRDNRRTEPERARKHGYNFLAPSGATGTETAVALTAMGRFAHEASVGGVRTGIVYQTRIPETAAPSTRFLPNDVEDLAQGGRLQMLAVTDQPRFTAGPGRS
jgi:secreted PhoX family phosphatase